MPLKSLFLMLHFGRSGSILRRCAAPLRRLFHMRRNRLTATGMKSGRTGGFAKKSSENCKRAPMKPCSFCLQNKDGLMRAGVWLGAPRADWSLGEHLQNLSLSLIGDPKMLSYLFQKFA